MALFRFNLHHGEQHLTKQNVDEKRYKWGKLLIFACFFLYTSSMAAKGVFAAEQKYIVDLWNLEYSEASMANTFYFVAYGLVQVVLFFLMSKINLNKYILVTVPFAAITTVLIGFATNIQQIWIYFGLSGLFQAAIYCGCMQVLTKYLPTKLLTNANRLMNVGYAVGTVVAYLMCALCVGYDLWQLPYYIIGTIFMSSVIVFGIVVAKTKRFEHINEILDKSVVNATKGKIVLVDENDPLFTVKTKKRLIIFYVIDLLFAFLITALFYCIMNYITSLLVDVHHLSQDISIYVSILAPITIAIGPMLTIYTCDRHKDFIKQGIIYSLIILPIPALLALFYQVNLFLALGLSIVFIVIANGIKAIVLSIMSFRMRKFINAGAYSAISNAVASISAGVTPTIIGRIIDVSGWAAAYWVTFGLVAVIIVGLVAVDIYVRREYRKTHNLKNSDKI